MASARLTRIPVFFLCSLYLPLLFFLSLSLRLVLFVSGEIPEEIKAKVAVFLPATFLSAIEI